MLERWQKNEPLYADKLNKSVDAINGAPSPVTRRPTADGAGTPHHWGFIITVFETGLLDDNGNPCQWTVIVHEVYKVGEGYDAEDVTAWEALPEIEGFRGRGYFTTLNGMDGTEIPADIKLVAPVVGDLVEFRIVTTPSGGREAWITTPLNSECV